MKLFTVKLIDELGGCYFSFTSDYKTTRKAVGLWRKEHKNILCKNRDITLYKSPNGEELWVYKENSDNR